MTSELVESVPQGRATMNDLQIDADLKSWGQPIPDDLKAAYNDRKPLEPDESWQHGFVLGLIERIARAEAENKRLKAPVSHQEYKRYAHKLANGYYYTEAQVNALIASRATEDK